jgi:uncharacterized damage-inducible protein DinB
MKRNFLLVAAVVACGASSLPAQDNPVSTGTKTLYTMIKTNIVKAAQKMPEENYSYKPTPDVRSFGQIIGHIADSQYEFCAPVKGDKKSSDVEKTKTSKADLIAALQQAFTYCDGVYNSMTDTAAAEKVKFFGQDSTRIGLLNFNMGHDNEHYGNIVTYMRLKGLVPPSSESNGSR